MSSGGSWRGARLLAKAICEVLSDACGTHAAKVFFLDVACRTEIGKGGMGEGGSKEDLGSPRRTG